MSSFTFTPTPEEDRFWRLFEAMRADVAAAVKSNLIYLTIHNVRASALDIQEKLGTFPEFWTTVMFSLQTTFFVSLGRLFDRDSNALSVKKLLETTINTPTIFSKNALRRRKRFDCRIQGDDPQWLCDYINNAWEPARADLDELLKALEPHSAKFKQIYKPIRDRIYAHRSKEDETEVYALFGKTSIGDIEGILRFLHTLLWALRELALDGRKPDLGDFRDYGGYIAGLRTEAENFLRRLV
jgi:hypothetical protein